MSTRARSPEGSGEPTPSTDRDALAEALEAGLGEVLPGIEVFDRDLTLDGGGRADLAAVDGAGRVVLVLVADDPVQAVLDALDALSFATRHAGLFARHWPNRRIQSDLAPRLVVVSPDSDALLVARLAPMRGRGIDVYGVKVLTSQAGERSYLVPLAPPVPAADTEAMRPGDVFLEALPRELATFGRAVVERIGRLDEQLEVVAAPDSILWRFQNHVLVRIESVGSGLRGAVGPDHEPRALASEADLDQLVESALARLVTLIGRAGAPRGDAGLGNGDRVRTTPRLDESEILTPEEIQAFRE